ncbi:MAG: hypothetical protein AB7P03_09650 [Kofleriaceae bacterium]
MNDGSNSDVVKSGARTNGIILGLIATALLGFAAMSKSWLAHPQMGISFGPLGCRNCNSCFATRATVFDRDSPDRTEEISSARCIYASEGMSNGAFVEQLRDSHNVLGEDVTSDAFAPLGWVTFVGLIIATLALATSAGLALANKRPQLRISPASLATIGVMVSLIAGCIFVGTKPGGPGFVAMSHGFWAFGIGSVVGIAAAQMLSKVIRPLDPDLMADAMNPDQF